MRNIYDLTLQELEEYFIQIGEKPFRATQVYEGLYKKRLNSFDEMTNISKELREKLTNDFSLFKIKLLIKQTGKDVNKYLFELEDGNKIESVLMFHDYGTSICVSSQVGCNMTCAFCESGKLKKVRNLSTSEIILEVLTIEKLENIKVDNIVVMGIGEPFDNFDNLVNAIKILNCPKGIDLGSRRITVSTCGIVPKIKEFAELDTQVNLAISLHAPNQAIREMLMPISKAYKMDELMSAVDYYISKTNRKVTMEYILLEGINDSIENAKELSNLLKGKLVYVNLIPYNSTSSNFKRSSKEKINAFYDELVKNKINVQMRREMGKGIKGACGQLKASHENKL